MRKPIAVIPAIACLFLLACLCADAQQPPAQNPPPPKKKDFGMAERQKAKDLISKYFKSTDMNERADILKQVYALDPLPKGEISSFVNVIFQNAMQGPKCDGKGECTLDSKEYPGKFLVRGASKAKSGKKLGLLIGLHGGGAGVGDASESAQKWEFAASKDLICVFPQVLEKGDAEWNKEKEELYVLELIEEMKRSFNIDTDRVYLVGHSMGGYGTWSIGAHHADLFAALSSCAGGVFVMSMNGEMTGLTKGVLPNLLNCPIYFYHSTDDPQVPAKSDQMADKILKELKYDYVYKEYTNVGHGLPPDGLGPIVEWLIKHKRNPYPKKIVWETFHAFKKFFYWIKVDEPPQGAKIAAEAKADNSITVTAEGVSSGITVFLNEKLVDLRKPVKVILNGEEKFSGMLEPSLGALLETIAAKRDINMYFAYRVGL